MNARRGLWMLVTLLAAVVLLAAGEKTVEVRVAAAPAPAPAAPVEAERPRVEVVFVLDTTGSMGGLIQAAKEKIWAIANTLVSAKPTPEIKMGLVAYRDRGDAYVTKHTALTNDLDAVYKELMGYQAQGGGDTPESVNQALHEAVTMMQWSTDPKVYRVIFLVGDSPPHMDYADDVKFPVSCELAAKNGIIVNTIQCGTNDTTMPIWQQIALKSEGRYFRVEQSGGAILATTPFDAKLAALATELDGTRVYYGERTDREVLEKRLGVAGEIDKTASTSAKARRAELMAKPEAATMTFFGKSELNAEVAAGRVKLEDVKTDDLPEKMQKMTPEERKRFVEENIAKRKALQEEIRKLSEQRQQYLKDEIAKRADGGRNSLGGQVYDTIREQARKKGIEYTDGPSH
ncbi:MAG TPA: VWA domain-containing protein [Planctomycetota bacterium]|nr:VWA domain-containing protein [Planctomycetota bacterium]